MFHHVHQHMDFSDPNSHLSVTTEFLDTLLDSLSRNYDFISLDEMTERITNPKGNKGKRPFLSVTLDDGYRDNLINALPVFEKHEVPFTIYIAPEMVEGRSTIWWEDVWQVIRGRDLVEVEFPDGHRRYDTSSHKKKRKAYQKLMASLFQEVSESKQREMVSRLCLESGVDDHDHVKREIADWEELKKLADHPLCTLGAHGMNHYVSAKLDEKELRWELDESRSILKQKLSINADHFAYPYGYHEAVGAREFALARECGFKTAVTTRHGVLQAEHANHMTALPRISVNGNFQSVRYVKALLSGLPTRINNRGSSLDVA